MSVPLPMSVCPAARHIRAAVNIYGINRGEPSLSFPTR